MIKIKQIKPNKKSDLQTAGICRRNQVFALVNQKYKFPEPFKQVKIIVEYFHEE
jgi:hypothetical protein